MTARALREKVLSLPVAERLTLVEQLWDSIAEDQHSLPLSDADARLIDDRLADDEARPREVVSWKDAVKHARRQVARKKKR